VPSPAGSCTFSSHRLRQREGPGRPADAHADSDSADTDRDQHGDGDPADGDCDSPDSDRRASDRDSDERSANSDACPANADRDRHAHAHQHGHANADLRRAGTGRLQLPDADPDRQPVRTRTGRMPDRNAHSATLARTGRRQMNRSNDMALSLPEVIGFVPKTTALVVKAVNTVGQIKELPEKNAKTVAAVLGITEGSLLHDIIDLTDDIIEAGKS